MSYLNLAFHFLELQPEPAMLARNLHRSYLVLPARSLIPDSALAYNRL